MNNTIVITKVQKGQTSHVSHRQISNISPENTLKLYVQKHSTLIQLIGNSQTALQPRWQELSNQVPNALWFSFKTVFSSIPSRSVSTP